MGEAPSEAPSSREVTFEVEPSKAAQETAEGEQFKYTRSEAEDSEAGRFEAEKQKYILQQPPTGPCPPLKKSLDKGKQPQLQGYTERSGHGNQPPIKERRQKQSQKENLSQESYPLDQSKSRAEGSKKADRSKRRTDYDSDNDPSSEGSDAGRDADRCDSDVESDKENEAE